MNEFDFKVELRPQAKNYYDSQILRDGEYRDKLIWCYENIGNSNWFPDGVWAQDFRYSDCGKFIIEYFTFKRKCDALFFTLRWS